MISASLAPIEAAALKLPSLMTKGCSTAEILTDDVDGYLAEENANAWADKIEKIIADKNKLNEVKEMAYKQVYRSWDSVVEEVRNFYLWAINDKKSQNNQK